MLAYLANGALFLESVLIFKKQLVNLYFFCYQITKMKQNRWLFAKLFITFIIFIGKQVKLIRLNRICLQNNTWYIIFFTNCRVMNLFLNLNLNIWIILTYFHNEWNTIILKVCIMSINFYLIIRIWKVMAYI